MAFSLTIVWYDILPKTLKNSALFKEDFGADRWPPLRLGERLNKFLTNYKKTYVTNGIEIL